MYHHTIMLQSTCRTYPYYTSPYDALRTPPLYIIPKQPMVVEAALCGRGGHNRSKKIPTSLPSESPKGVSNLSTPGKHASRRCKISDIFFSTHESSIVAQRYGPNHGPTMDPPSGHGRHHGPAGKIRCLSANSTNSKGLVSSPPPGKHAS